MSTHRTLTADEIKLRFPGASRSLLSAAPAAPVVEKPAGPTPAQHAWSQKEERKIQDEIAAWLRVKGIPTNRSRMDRKSTGTKGYPDFCCHWGPMCILIEVKTATGKPSECQKEFHALCEAAGTPVLAARSAQEAIDYVLETWPGVRER